MEPMRTCKGYALGLTVSTRGGGHCSGAPLTETMGWPTEVSKKMWRVTTAGKPTLYEGKAKIVVYYERLHEVLNSLGICFITSNWWSWDLLGPDDYAKLFSTATGWNVTGKELMTIGERIHNVEKAFNVLHAGFNRHQDYPPIRFMRERVKSGPLKGERLEKDKWDAMLSEYYMLHGWDKKTGYQTRKCLEALDLVEVAGDLEKVSKLARS